VVWVHNCEKCTKKEETFYLLKPTFTLYWMITMQGMRSDISKPTLCIKGRYYYNFFGEIGKWVIA
jgi:hypothetical protein